MPIKSLTVCVGVAHNVAREGRLKEVLGRFVFLTELKLKWNKHVTLKAIAVNVDSAQKSKTVTWLLPSSTGVDEGQHTSFHNLVKLVC